MGIGYYIFVDLFVLGLLFALTVVTTFDLLGGPSIRGFFRHDHSIGLPIANPEHVPVLYLFLYSIILPIIIMAFSWIFIDKIFSNSFQTNTSEYQCQQLNNHVLITTQTTTNTSLKQALTTDPLLKQQQSLTNTTTPIYKGKKHHVNDIIDKPTYLNWGIINTIDSTPRSRKIRFACFQFCIFLFVTLLCLTITNSIKGLVGRLRPDFLARCQFNYDHPDVIIDSETGYIAPKYAFGCRGTESEIREGRKSFPSGHSSSAMTTSMFLALYLYKRFYHRGRHWFGVFFIPLLCMGLITGALLIAASRHIDGRHHFADITCGLLIGLFCAFTPMLFQLDVFIPSWEYDGSINNGTANNSIVYSDHDVETHGDNDYHIDNNLSMNQGDIRSNNNITTNQTVAISLQQ